MLSPSMTLGLMLFLSPNSIPSMSVNIGNNSSSWNPEYGVSFTQSYQNTNHPLNIPNQVMLPFGRVHYPSQNSYCSPSRQQQFQAQRMKAIPTQLKYAQSFASPIDVPKGSHATTPLPIPNLPNAAENGCQYQGLALENPSSGAESIQTSSANARDSTIAGVHLRETPSMHRDSSYTPPFIEGYLSSMPLMPDAIRLPYVRVTHERPHLKTSLSASFSKPSVPVASTLLGHSSHGVSPGASMRAVLQGGQEQTARVSHWSENHNLSAWENLVCSQEHSLI